MQLSLKKNYTWVTVELRVVSVFHRENVTERLTFSPAPKNKHSVADRTKSSRGTPPEFTRRSRSNHTEMQMLCTSLTIAL